MKLKKLLASFMAACMVSSAVPVTALANENVNVAAIGNAEYTSIQAAVVAAEDGDEIDVIADHEMEYANAVENSDGYAVLVNVADKEVTIDLNGKEITVNADAEKVIEFKSEMLMAVFAVDTEGELTLTDSSDGDGEVNVTANDTNVYSVVTNYNADGLLNIEGGRYIVDEVSSWSMIYSGGGDKTTTVSGGYFELGNGRTLTHTNGETYPWIFNAYDDGRYAITVTGGTYNIDPRHYHGEVYVPEGYTVAEKSNGKWVVKEKDFVAAIGDNKYESIQEAINAANTGETVTLLENIDLSAEDAVETTDKLPVLVLVEGKDITLDLNRKTISVDHQSTTDRIYSVVHVADGAGLTVTGKGEIDVDTNDDTPKVAYLFWKRGTTGSLVIENGTYYMDNSEDSMVYTNGDEIVTINGGTFTLDAVGTGENGSPWIFNAQGKDDKKITVNGGTFNADINHQYWADEVYVPQDKALKVNDDTWTIVDAIAYVAENYWTYGEYDPRTRYVGYATLEEAIGAADDNGEDITLLADGKITSGTVNCEIIPNGYNLEITGGTFVSEPSDNFYLADCVVTGCTAEKTKDDGTEWTIVPAAGSVATIGNVGYKTLAEAVAVAENNDVIVLLENNSENVTVSREVTFKLDTNDKEFTGSIVAGEGYKCEKDGDTYEFTKKDSSDTPSTSSSKKSSKKYSVEIEDMEDGAVKASSTRVKKGATVTLTVTPDKGYELDKLVVLDSDGDEVELKDKGNGKFTFVMPRGGVEVEASFEEADEPVVDEPDEDKEKTTLVLTIGQVIYQLNGEYKVNDVAPIIQNDRTFLPIRLVADTLGATVSWSEADQAVTIVKGDTTIVIYIGQAFALVNGEPVELDAPAFIANDRTYLPVRFVAENLGATVTWNDVENTVTIVAK